MVTNMEACGLILSLSNNESLEVRPNIRLIHYVSADVQFLICEKKHLQKKN
jgi:hypothetical protein